MQEKFKRTNLSIIDIISFNENILWRVTGPNTLEKLVQAKPRNVKNGTAESSCERNIPEIRN